MSRQIGVDMRYLDMDKANKFLGTGENNSVGESLEEFLENYDPNRYQHPSNTVDTLVFSYKEEKGIKRISKLLMIKRGNHPGIGWWALPGGFIEFTENLDEAAKRELQEETGIEDIEIEQLGCYGDYDRDPRTRIITTAYVALVEEGSVRAQAGDDAKDAGWFEIQEKLLLCSEDKETFLLTMDDLCNNIKLQAKIEVTMNSKAILKNKKYSVIERDLLCADHGAIILQGYHYIKQLLKQ